MKQYPSIQHYNKGLYGEKIYAFDKLDGSNIRAEYSCKRKEWYKFGTKTSMIDKKSDFADAIPIFKEKYGDKLAKVFSDKYPKIESVVVFCEYLGETSFAGRHSIEDKKDLILFDVSLYKKGFVHPNEFIDNFGHLDIPKLVYEGKYTDEFINDIRKNIYNLSEGVICKGVVGKEVWMTKVKTLEWLRKVKELHGEKYLYMELNNDKQLIKSY